MAGHRVKKIATIAVNNLNGGAILIKSQVPNRDSQSRGGGEDG
jgi:hypothetical protein